MMRFILAPLMALVMVVSLTAAAAWAGENGGMCKADDSRVHIPSDFPIDACFDGKTLVLNNGTQFPLVLSIAGNGLGNPQRYSQGEADGASALLAGLRPGDFGATPQIGKPDVHSGVVPPNYHLKVDVGNNQASVHLGTADAGEQKMYLIAEAIWRYAPLGGLWKAGVDLVNELAQVGDQYITCRARNNALGDVGCSLLMGRNVAFALGRAVVNGLVAPVVKAVIALFDSAKWANAAVGDLMSIRGGTRDFTISAYTPPPPPTTTQAPPPPVHNPSGSGGNNNPPSQNLPPPSQPQSTIATVQNMHLDGAAGLAEDSTPSYLSSSMQPRCASNGCKIDGTEMWSGATFTAVCWDDGAFMTNQNANIPDDDHNPNRIDTTRWLKGSFNGQTGFISFIYITPASRGVVGHC